jgi:hypothetical protein
MTVATLNEAPRLVTPGLTLAVDFELDGDVQSELDAYHDDCRKLDARVHGSHGLHDDRARLLAAAATTTVGALQKAGPELVKRKASLEAEIADLRWRKFSLIPLLLPFAKQAAQEAERQYEQAIAAEIDSLAEVGITPETMDAGKLGNFEAANIQLRHRATNCEAVLVMQCAKNEAATAVIVLEAQFNCPTPAQCVIRWEALTGFAAKIAELAGVVGSQPMQIPIRTQKAGRVAAELGFNGAALLPSHCDLLESIGELLPEGHRPLSLVTTNKLDKVRGLVGKLPPTAEVKRFLHATSNGVIRHIL